MRELVPESQAYMDLLSFERKLDSTIMRKRLDIQEALKRPMKVGINMKYLIFIFNVYHILVPHVTEYRRDISHIALFCLYNVSPDCIALLFKLFFHDFSKRRSYASSFPTRSSRPNLMKQRR